MKSITTNKKQAIIEILSSEITTREDLAKIKRIMAKKYKIDILYNSDILKEYEQQKKLNKILISSTFKSLLRKRSIRTLSGVAPVAVLTKPHHCPGKCIYCPKEKNVPQSYLSNEPAVMRAILCSYNPYQQVQLRLNALEANGHYPTKIELIVIGGTWSVLPEKYKYWYIKECFKAANEYKKNQKSFRNSAEQEYSKLKIKILKKLLANEQKKNETAKYNIIGITLETRPDYINEKELLEMRELGATRIEMGVQAINNKILKINRRGHNVKEIVNATKLLKNYGFKITYHIMPCLPGSTAKKDLSMFKQLFNDKRFQPDQIKFYPTIVTRGSLLYKWWREKKYKPYSNEVLQNLIIACKETTPQYVRIIRLIRDIPEESIIAGNKITNLRQILKNKNIKCECIRCREARDKKFLILNSKISIIKYKASCGEEYFIQMINKKDNTLYGFCRLRLPNKKTKNTQLDILNNTALIRELHIYGELIPIGQEGKIQHTGLGKILMAEAEKIAKQNDFKKITIIAGVGVRDYYRKLKYNLTNSYMTKNLI